MPRRLLLLLALCGCVGGPNPPEPLAARAYSATPTLGDPMQAEPTWLDRSGEVMRVRGGVLETVQERNLLEEVPNPRALRVFDDGNILTVDTSGTVHAMPVGESAVALSLEGLVDAIDGVSIADFWHTDVASSPHRLCHAIGGSTTSCVDLPEVPVQAYSLLLSVASDGSVYVYDGATTTHRFADGALTPIAGMTRAVAGFRGRGGVTLATTLDGQAFALEGDEARTLDFVPRLAGTAIAPIVGTRDDYYVLSYEDEPALSSCSFGDCAAHRVRWQQRVWRVVDGAPRVIAYEECSETDGRACDRETFGLALDGDVAVVMGVPFRAATGS